MSRQYQSWSDTDEMQFEFSDIKDFKKYTSYTIKSRGDTVSSKKNKDNILTSSIKKFREETDDMINNI